MTRNLYLGADVERLVAELGTATDDAGIVRALARGMAAVADVVAATDFSVRAGLLADEIAAAQPDLIGLQEVALWRRGPVSAVGELDAAEVEYDFLELLVEALGARGCRYDVAASAVRADVECPAYREGGEPGARDRRLTMRDVILARPGLDIIATGQRRFDANLELVIGGVDLGPERGWQWVDVAIAGGPVRLVNTHLESLSADIGLAQAHELVAAIPRDLAALVVGDFNSDPLDHAPRGGAAAAPSAAYEAMVGGGYADGWLASGGVGPGFTAGLNERLDDPTGAGFDHRLDFVFGRGAGGSSLRWLAPAVVTGAAATARDPRTGLWPSDHAGVVTTVALPPR